MIPAPPKVGPPGLELDAVPVPVDEVPPGGDPGVPELSVLVVPGAPVDGD